MLYPYNGILLHHETEQVLIHATKRMNLEKIMLSESQSQKVIYYQNRQIYTDRNRLVLQGLWWLEGLEAMAEEYGGKKNVLKLIWVVAAQFY